jgi:hypothetical protein
VDAVRGGFMIRHRDPFLSVCLRKDMQKIERKYPPRIIKGEQARF